MGIAFNILVIHIVLGLITFIFVTLDKKSPKENKGSQIVVTFFLPVLGPVLVSIGLLYVNTKPGGSDRIIGQSIDESRAAHQTSISHHD